MLHKVETNLKFNPKRNFHLTTPCCNRKNNDGKFVNYIDIHENYGFCHSCGKTTLPPTVYRDENGNEMVWNNIQNRYEPFSVLTQEIFKPIQTNQTTVEKPLQFIDESTIWKFFHAQPENNLLKYLRNNYNNEKVEAAKLEYAIGTSNDGGTIFWNINTDLQVQKAKISYYNLNGKRTNKFKVPYTNGEGFVACLFGEHLIYESIKGKKIIILLESEKSAIVGHLHLPEYVWLAYGGSNGLNENKLKPLIGHTVLIIPDMSETAVNIIYEKLPLLISMGINAKIWDLTEGKTDVELRSLGIYNNDLEDVFRKFI